MEINELKKLSKNKKVIYIDNTFSVVLKYIIKKSLYDYKGIPVEVEDIYYQFLYETPKLIDKFDENKGISLKTYLGIKCKFSTLRICKEFTSWKHKVMNTYVDITKVPDSILLQDSVIDKIPMNVAKLTDEELIVYKNYFLEDNTIKWVVDNTDFSKRKTTRLIGSIKIKLLNQLEIN